MSDIQAILFDAGGTLIHVDGERFCAAAAIPFEAERFARAEAAATGRVRAWILRHPGGIMPVVGTTNPDRLRACCQGAEVELSRIEWYQIYSAAMGHGVP